MGFHPPQSWARRGRIKHGSTIEWGVPGVQFSALATSVLAANTARYSWFEVDESLVIEACQVEVTTGPASDANVRIGIYAADVDWQPTGAPLFDSGAISVATGATGVKYATGFSVRLHPGLHCVVVNADVAMTCRRLNGGPCGVGAGMGSASFIGGGTVAQTFGAFPTPADAWTTVTPTSIGGMHLAVFRWS